MASSQYEREASQGQKYPPTRMPASGGEDKPEVPTANHTRAAAHRHAAASGDVAGPFFPSDNSSSPMRKPESRSPESCCIVQGCSEHGDHRPVRIHRTFVCLGHQAADFVDLPGDGPSRFCQRCARFHPVENYDGSKRSCRDSLSAHNLRRRRKRAANAAVAVSKPTVPEPKLYCIVEACGKLLSPDRPAHRRCKVCGEHQRVLSAVVKGVVQRFCQQCSRFHPLGDFDGNKHSCRVRLASHNFRRRKLMQASGADEGGEDAEAAKRAYRESRMSAHDAISFRDMPPDPHAYDDHRGAPAKGPRGGLGPRGVADDRFAVPPPPGYSTGVDWALVSEYVRQMTSGPASYGLPPGPTGSSFDGFHAVSAVPPHRGLVQDLHARTMAQVCVDEYLRFVQTEPQLSATREPRSRDLPLSEDLYEYPSPIRPHNICGLPAAPTSAFGADLAAQLNRPRGQEYHRFSRP
mmetsp:Transcript_40342/g.114202  ORF Transcript_40342/g.114202 Transcript_40342/m.114202 type:complete len:463 (-) Transcript_40342:309-1697(-)